MEDRPGSPESSVTLWIQENQHPRIIMSVRTRGRCPGKRRVYLTSSQVLHTFLDSWLAVWVQCSKRLVSSQTTSRSRRALLLSGALAKCPQPQRAPAQHLPLICNSSPHQQTLTGSLLDICPCALASSLTGTVISHLGRGYHIQPYHSLPSA